MVNTIITAIETASDINQEQLTHGQIVNAMQVPVEFELKVNELLT